MLTTAIPESRQRFVLAIPHVVRSTNQSTYAPVIVKLTYTGWAKKTAHGFLCNNFAYSQPIFIIFWPI